MVLFLDDDFLPAPDYLAVTEAVFAARPDAVVTDGTVIADGAKGPGLSVAEGRALLAADRPPADPLACAPHFNGYGCNMAVRMATVRAHGIRVDEALPLYAWYEDIDFTRRLGRHGAILRLEGARGVHLGVKSGRVPGRRLGYSQVANPIYLARKGTFPWSHALPSALRHLADERGARRLAGAACGPRRAVPRQPARAVGPAARPRVAGPGPGAVTDFLFVLSKLLWLALRPGTFALLLALVGLAAVWRGRRWGRWPILAGLGFYLALLLLPLHIWVQMPLEDRFPRPADAPPRVDGIVVLGGAVEQELTEARGIPALNGAAERMTEPVALMRRYPEARLVFTGGQGTPAARRR